MTKSKLHKTPAKNEPGVNVFVYAPPYADGALRDVSRQTHKQDFLSRSVFILLRLF